MSLINATESATSSTTNKPAEGAIFNSLLLGDINTEVAIQSGNGSFKASFVFIARIEKNIVQLEQSDRSHLNLNDIEDALKTRGYRVSCNVKNRPYGGIKVQLCIAWD